MDARFWRAGDSEDDSRMTQDDFSIMLRDETVQHDLSFPFLN